MSLSQPLLEPGTDVSRFRVEQLLARGGMGLVYRARDVRLDRPVALKVLAPELSQGEEFRQRFVRECRLAAALEHPHVVPVYEADDWHGLLYVAMRFVYGADLASVLRGGPLPVPAAVDLLGQAASALDAAHGAGLVHRDVKPGNLLVSGASPGHVPQGAHLYLTDFGLTKQAGSLSGLTRSGTFLGSLHYVAPEQIQGEDVDGRADLYSLACVAFELLAGAPPFRRDQEAALLWAHVSVPPPRLTDVRPDLPPAVADVLAHGMAKGPGDRPASCGEFVAALRTAAGHRSDDAVPARAPQREPAPVTVVGAAGVATVPPAPPPPPPGAPAGDPGRDAPGAGRHRSTHRRRRRRLRGAVVAIGVVVAALVAGLLLWWPDTDADPAPPLAVRSLDVAPFTMALPEDWVARPVSVQDVPGFVEAVVFAAEDWQGVQLEDAASLAAAAETAAEDPDRLVFVYADAASGLDPGTPDQVAEQLAASFPGEPSLEDTGVRGVGDEEGVLFTGSVPLGEEQELRVYGVVVPGRLLVLCAAPDQVFGEWAATFREAVGSIAAE